jgi:hypothetical protein
MNFAVAIWVRRGGKRCGELGEGVDQFGRRGCLTTASRIDPVLFTTENYLSDALARVNFPCPKSIG